MTLGWFSGLTALLMVLVIFILMRRDRVPIMHSLWWLAVAALILILGVNPRIIDSAATLVGVSYPPSLLFVGAILVLFIKVLLEDIDVSNDRRRIINLVQKVAILEEELKRFKGETQTNQNQTD